MASWRLSDDLRFGMGESIRFAQTAPEHVQRLGLIVALCEIASSLDRLEKRLARVREELDRRR